MANPQNYIFKNETKTKHNSDLNDILYIKLGQSSNELVANLEFWPHFLENLFQPSFTSLELNMIGTSFKKFRGISFIKWVRMPMREVHISINTICVDFFFFFFNFWVLSIFNYTSVILFSFYIKSYTFDNFCYLLVLTILVTVSTILICAVDLLHEPYLHRFLWHWHFLCAENTWCFGLVIHFAKPCPPVSGAYCWGGTKGGGRAYHRGRRCELHWQRFTVVLN